MLLQDLGVFLLTVLFRIQKFIRTQFLSNRHYT